MDLYKNVDRIKVMLLQTCGCSPEEAIIVCEKTIQIIKSQVHNKSLNQSCNQPNAQENDATLQRRQDGYKIVRFKKPLPPLEERKVYQRVCHRCDNIYKTFGKYSWYCDSCKKSTGGNHMNKKVK